MKNDIVIPYADFLVLLKALGKMEKPKTIAGLAPHQFLLIIARKPQDKSTPVGIRVKKCILDISGNYSTKPENLKDGIDLKKNYNWQSKEFKALTLELNVMVKEYKKTAKVTSSDIDEVKTVGDVVEMVEKKII